MEYIAKMSKMVDVPVRQVFSITELKYRQLAAGGRFARLRLRLAMYVGYPLKVLAVALMARPTAILIVSSNTFFAPLLAWAGSRMRRPVIVHWRCDLYPDALVVARNIPEGGWVEYVIGCVQWLMNRTCDQVVAVGGLLLEHADLRWGKARRSAYIDNVPSDETNFFHLIERTPASLGFHYGGQMGYMHEPDSMALFVRVALQVGGPRVHFDFRMSGAYRPQFEAAIRGTGLVVNGPIENAEWKVLIQNYQVGLVSLSPGGAMVSLPSKIYSMLAGGLAIVAVCPAWSDLAEIVRITGGGWVINNSPHHTVAQLKEGDYARNCQARRSAAEVAAESGQLVAELLADQTEVERRRRNAVRAAHEIFGLPELRRRWAAVLEQF